MYYCLNTDRIEAKQVVFVNLTKDLSPDKQHATVTKATLYSVSLYNHLSFRQYSALFSFFTEV